MCSNCPPSTRSHRRRKAKEKVRAANQHWDDTEQKTSGVCEFSCIFQFHVSYTIYGFASVNYTIGVCPALEECFNEIVVF